jgi:hypothetical protein
MPSLRDLADRVLGRRPAPPPRLELPRVPTSEEILADLERFYDDVDDRVPPMVVSRIKRIVAVVRDTIPRLDNLGAGSPQAHSVVATATSYLPEAVGAYLRLPRSWADTRPVSGGKTSLMVLCDQLDLLATTMDRAMDSHAVLERTPFTHGPRSQHRPPPRRRWMRARLPSADQGADEPLTTN